MLVRLKRVDVYDNRITYTPSIEAITARWPDHNALVETKFVAGFLDMKQVNKRFLSYLKHLLKNTIYLQTKLGEKSNTLSTTLPLNVLDMAWTLNETSFTISKNIHSYFISIYVLFLSLFSVHHCCREQPCVSFWCI